MVGGDVTINPTGKREVSTILLTPDAITKRVALVDNLKSLHFSNAEIESTITGTKIDGNKLYDGYGIRPNYMTWFITVNGANLSKDLSQRLVAVHLSKPSYNPTWLLELDSFISNRRWGIIADAIAELQSASQSANTGTATRHGAWESAVLAKLPDAEALSLLIAARKESTDGDDDDVAEIESAIEIALKARGFDSKAETVFIETKDLADIVRPFTGHSSVIGIMRWLFCLPLTRLTRSKNNSKRGGIWNYSPGKHSVRYDAPGLPELPDIF